MEGVTRVLLAVRIPLTCRSVGSRVKNYIFVHSNTIYGIIILPLNFRAALKPWKSATHLIGGWTVAYVVYWSFGVQIITASLIIIDPT